MKKYISRNKKKIYRTIEDIIYGTVWIVSFYGFIAFALISA